MQVSWYVLLTLVRIKHVLICGVSFTYLQWDYSSFSRKDERIKAEETVMNVRLHYY